MNKGSFGNVTTNNSTDNLAVQTSFLMSMLLIHACQEKNIFSNLFLARRNPKSKLFGMNAVIQSGSEGIPLAYSFLCDVVDRS